MSKRNAEIHHALNARICKALVDHAANLSRPKLLDIGCWDGGTTASYGRTLPNAQLFGVECFPDMAEKARLAGVTVSEIDLEVEALPFADRSFDLVVCNQVFEHLKQIFSPMDEISRVLRPGGLLIFSVPNMAALHNRLLLLLGIQPTCLRVFGPHVRGFTVKEARNYLEHGGVFTLLDLAAVGFYPLPAFLMGNLIASFWKDAAHTPIFVMKRTDIAVAKWKQYFQENPQQTVI